MSGTMLLNHIGLREEAGRIKTAYNAVMADGKPDELTADVGGRGTTSGFADAIIARL